ncbi:hypothetical protein KCU95_g14550, partial [Aureobasidium melanogenum]
MHSIIQHLVHKGNVSEKCICQTQWGYCNHEIDNERLESAREILTSQRFRYIKTDLDYHDDLRELARCSFCECCENNVQVKTHRAKLVKCMSDEQQKERPVEIGTTKTSERNINTASTKVDSYGYEFKAADCTMNTQGLKRRVPPKTDSKDDKVQTSIDQDEIKRLREKVRNLEAEKAGLDHQILDLTKRLEHEHETAASYLEAGNTLLETYEQVKRKYATDKARWEAKESGLLMRIAKSEQHNHQLQQESRARRMANVRELLQVSGAVKVLHDKLSWILGSHPEDEVEEEL